MDLAQRLGTIVIGTLLVGGLALAISACLSNEITNDDRQRCCTCLYQSECLEDGATTTTCRDELTNEGSTEFDPDCESDNCGRECDFLYW